MLEDGDGPRELEGRKLAAQLVVLPQVGKRLLERPVFQPPLVLRVDDEFIFRIPFVLGDTLVILVLHRVDRGSSLPAHPCPFVW